MSSGRERLDRDADRQIGRAPDQAHDDPGEIGPALTTNGLGMLRL